MGAKATRAGVSEFLERFKAGVVAGQLLFVPREQNLSVIGALGLTIDEAEQIILNLTEAHISSAQEENPEGKPNVLCFFYPFEAGRGLNLELKISTPLAACLSLDSQECHTQTNTPGRRHTYEEC
jgi:hypothetical protein